MRWFLLGALWGAIMGVTATLLTVDLLLGSPW